MFMYSLFPTFNHRQVVSEERSITADTVIIATGAVARRLVFKGSGEEAGGFWNKGISACAVCDGAAPIFRNKPIAVIGGGDSAMEVRVVAGLSIVHAP